MSTAELEGPRFQSGTQILDTVGYLENMVILETYKLQDGSNLRISTNLDDLPGTRGDNSELNGPLETDETKLGIGFGINNVHFKKLQQRVKLCRLFVIKNSVFNNSSCAQKLFCWT